MFWLLLVLVLVLVLDPSCNYIIPSWSTRCSGGNLVMDRLMGIRSMIRDSGNSGLWAGTQVAFHAREAFDYQQEPPISPCSDGLGAEHHLG